MIRNATKDDLSIILELGEAFYNTTIHSDIESFCPETTEKTLRHLIDDDSGILVVLDDDGVKGMAGALLYPAYMTGVLTGQELFWWCGQKGKGLGLLDEIERQARDAGATSFVMLSMDNMTPERLDKIYLEKGYNRSEHTYVKGF
jgi:hypothetical protein